VPPGTYRYHSSAAQIAIWHQISYQKYPEKMLKTFPWPLAPQVLHLNWLKQFQTTQMYAYGWFF